MIFDCSLHLIITPIVIIKVKCAIRVNLDLSSQIEVIKFNSIYCTPVGQKERESNFCNCNKIRTDA